MNLVREEGLVPAARSARRGLRPRPARICRRGRSPAPPEGSRPLLSHPSGQARAPLDPRLSTLNFFLVREEGLVPAARFARRGLRPRPALICRRGCLPAPLLVVLNLPSRTRLDERIHIAKWCERGVSNPHGFPHGILSPARLPVPPLSRQKIVGAIGCAFNTPRKD